MDGILMMERPTADDRACLVALEALVAAERSNGPVEQPAASTDLAHAIAALAELRAHCDALRADIATLTAERNTVQATLDEALAIQSQIWDAIGGQREGESLVDAVRRVVGDTKEASVSNQNDAGQRRTGFDASAQWVSRARTEQTSLADVGDGATIAAEAAWRRQLDEAREAGRAEAKAEIERLREKVESLDAALTRREVDIDRVSMERDMFREERDALREECDQIQRDWENQGARLHDIESKIESVRAYVAATDGEALIASIKRVMQETAGIAAERVVAQRDAAYRRGQEEMRERATIVAKYSSYAAADIRSLPIANAPTVSASEGPGEAGPGCGGTETAGAEESVALREEVARLRRELESVVTAESEAWVKATGASSPDEAEADANRDGETWEKQRVEIAFLRDVLAKRVAEIDSLHHQLSTAKTARDKARSERSRSDDALKAIEEALLSAGITSQGDESLVDTVCRALENRDVRATKVERVPQVGDMVNLRVSKGVHPCVVLHVWNDGSVNLRDLFDLDEVESRPRDDSGERLGTWRFRD